MQPGIGESESLLQMEFMYFIIYNITYDTLCQFYISKLNFRPIHINIQIPQPKIIVFNDSYILRLYLSEISHRGKSQHIVLLITALIIYQILILRYDKYYFAISFSCFQDIKPKNPKNCAFIKNLDIIAISLVLVKKIRCVFITIFKKSDQPYRTRILLK